MEHEDLRSLKLAHHAEAIWMDSDGMEMPQVNALDDLSQALHGI